MIASKVKKNKLGFIAAVKYACYLSFLSNQIPVDKNLRVADRTKP